MHINWFPGHMAKARRMIENNIKKVDVVIELLDARIPQSSCNPLIRELIGNKPHVIVLNKVDLADKQITKDWVEYFEQEGISVITIDSRTGKGRKDVVRFVQQKCQPIVDKWAAKGVNNRSMRTIILGIPNVGKSTLINALARSSAAKVANKPGQTRGPQWVRIGKNMELLDTPGVLWPKLEDQRAAARLAITGAISDDVYDLDTVVDALITELKNNALDKLIERYKLTKEDITTNAEILEKIGRKRGCLMSGGIVNIEKAQRILIGDYRDMKFGNISFDKPNEEAYVTEE